MIEHDWRSPSGDSSMMMLPQVLEDLTQLCRKASVPKSQRLKNPDWEEDELETTLLNKSPEP